jgi:AraC family transcriptional regulator
MAIYDRLSPVGLRAPNRLQTLIENRSVFTMGKSELNLYETFQECSNITLQFSDPIAVCMLSGKKVMHLPQSSTFDFYPGQSLILPSNQAMTIDFPNATLKTPTRCLALSISPQEIESTVNYLNEFFPKAESSDSWQVSTHSFYLGSDAHVSQTLSELVEIITEQTRAKEALAELKLRELLVRVMQTQARHLLITEAAASAATHRLAFAVTYIRERLHEAISIDELARKCCMSKSHFFRQFKHEFGLAPLEFITAERIKLAKKLLSKSSLSVSEAAYQTGFESLNYFIKVFKKHVGQTPKVFQMHTTHFT